VNGTAKPDAAAEVAPYRGRIMRSVFVLIDRRGGA